MTALFTRRSIGFWKSSSLPSSSAVFTTSSAFFGAVIFDRSSGIVSIPPLCSMTEFAVAESAAAINACSSVAPCPFASAKPEPNDGTKLDQYRGFWEMRVTAIRAVSSMPVACGASVDAEDAPPLIIARTAFGTAFVTP